MRLLPVCAIALASVTPLPATLVHVWHVSEIENAPALVVATKEGSASHEAHLRVLRAFPAGKFWAGEELTVRYVKVAPFIGTVLIPLAPDDAGGWRLIAETGLNMTVPALEEAPGNSGSTERAFILAELANTLANGSDVKRVDAASYLRNENAWPDGLREVLEKTIGNNEDRWAEAACAVLIGMGTPHSPISQLMAKENLAAEADKSAAWLLGKVPKRDYPDRLIRCALRDMPTYEWGASNVLLEFKDSPLVIEALTSSLKSNPSSSIYAAWVLIHNGQQTFLSEALDAAGKLVVNPTRPMEHLQPAAWLLRDYGSDAQFGVLLATMRRFKTTNETQYWMLFGAVDDRKSKRAQLSDAILLDDRRLAPNSRFRFCDLAAASIEAISGQHFGFKQEMTEEERDHAVAAAIAWLRNQ